ncbi:TPA: dimethyl sulfoxide reductase anchor subunit [Proteus mirabilis]|uniref:dimethyl sulfoxide reductase anchor subunit family protein n=1 Tax=Proteus TaxID=583 RepID=UPI00114009BB|nr:MULTISPECIES: DmsC/YnfH family molybdoenzyme membrane anchor subunit [Proteus]EKU2369253.1 dimethyl sulfoxide reductase anchor subunit [Proteus mirabilis]EKU7917226.1 dimethyl sulfoxide reductase anchor subunit [Proteus mirabilis]EKU7921172.1 dimethyl sulfoxide reductase anchor subunit [Proteus mirabilis]EKU8691281.1 dimethyl sulfoxide reductase anchor subunit [Proteus mirabilis]EKU8703167.1 dimethyl sulfoxide reductase anchor subunit [Proteus mirabilis]
MHELPLVFFTVLGSSAAGLFLIAYISKKLGQIDEQQLRNANILALILMLVGLGIGGLHVGQPLRFFNMLLGVGRSPMSNEAFLSGVFTGFAFATVALTIMKKWRGLREICNLFTVIFGLAFVWSIPQVYHIPTIANWNTDYTTLQFWMTLLIGGGVLAMVSGARRLGALSFIIGAIITFAARSGYVSFLSFNGPELSAEQSLFWGFQLAVLALGIVVVGFSALKAQTSRVTLATCAAAVVIAELSGRIAFYNLWHITM